jgi:hypothetical protein
MPELTAYDFNHPKALEDLAATETSTRRSTIDKAWAYYEGNHARPLKVRPGQADDNVIINMAKRVVNQTVFLLFGKVPKIALPEQKGPGDTGDAPKTTPAQEALDRIWEANLAEVFLHNLGTAGSLAGHNYVKLVPEPSHPAGVRLIRQEARNMNVFWLPDDRDHVVAYKIQWRSGDVQYRQDIINLESTWLIRDMRRGDDTDANWSVTGEETWPYDFAPIVDWQNLPDADGYYGQSDLENPALNDNLNLAASNINRILKHHAHPKTIGVGMTPDQVKDTAVDGFWAVPNTNAHIFNLEMVSDLNSSMAFAQFIQATFYGEHSAVDIASIKDRLGQLTNFGLRMLFWDALNKNDVKRALYGQGLARISQRALALIGYRDQALPTVQWGEALPFNLMEQVQALEKELDLGLVSRETSAGELGRDWETEQGRMAKEKPEPNPGADLLKQYEARPGQPTPAQLMGITPNEQGAKIGG